jgi:Membrane dipeptidase (Peptidase family M19)
MPGMLDETARLPDPRLLWEQHCCLPLSVTADLGELARYQRPGGSYVSVNVGYAPHSAADVLGLLAAFQYGAAADDRYVLVASVADVEQAHRRDQVAVSFDLEDSGPLEGDLGLVQQFYDLGVRTVLPTYNRQNAVGTLTMPSNWSAPTMSACPPTSPLTPTTSARNTPLTRSCSPRATPAGVRSISGHPKAWKPAL